MLVSVMVGAAQVFPMAKKERARLRDGGECSWSRNAKGQKYQDSVTDLDPQMASSHCAVMTLMT